MKILSPFLLFHLSLLSQSRSMAVNNNKGAAASKTNKKSSGGGSGGGGTGFGSSKTAWKCHITDDSATTQSLMQVLASSPFKADISNVEIGFSSERRRGLYAVKHIGKDKIICKIPSDCALALSDPSSLSPSSDEGSDDDAERSKLTWSQVGANFWNMYYNNPQFRQQWSWYLDTLPPPAVTESEATTNFWAPDEIDLLEFPRAIQQTKQRQQQIQQVAAEQGIDLKDLHYATWLVSSRSFSVPLSLGDSANTEKEVLRDERGQVLALAKERQSIQVMVPLLDMANYNTESNARWTILDPEKDDAWFALEATRPIPPGKEITLTYGSGGTPHSSVELLTNYGFVPKHNTIDSFMLQKGGNDVISSASGWSTTVDEDLRMLEMLEEDDHTMRKILSFRIRLKEAYKNA